MTNKELLEAIDPKTILRTEQHGDLIVIFFKNGIKFFINTVK